MLQKVYIIFGCLCPKYISYIWGGWSLKDLAIPKRYRILWRSMFGPADEMAKDHYVMTRSQKGCECKKNWAAASNVQSTSLKLEQFWLAPHWFPKYYARIHKGLFSQRSNWFGMPKIAPTTNIQKKTWRLSRSDSFKKNQPGVFMNVSMNVFFHSMYFRAKKKQMMTTHTGCHLVRIYMCGD